MKTDFEKIVFIEPKFGGMGHSLPNASILASLSSALPNVAVSVHASQTHMAALKEVFQTYHLAQDWELIAEADLPLPFETNGATYRQGRLWFQSNLKKWPAKALVVFGDLPQALLYELKHLPRGTTQSFLAIDHFPERVFARRGKRPWLWKYHYASLVRRSTHGMARTVLLGGGLSSRLNHAAGGLLPDVFEITHPRLPPLKNSGKSRGSGMHFGFLGGTDKSVDVFGRIAKTMKERGGNATFSIVGSGPLPPNLAGIFETPAKPFSFGEYERRIADLDFVINPVSPLRHDFRSSGTFVDTMSHGLPFLALKGSFFEYYFDRFGPAGYLARDADELLEVVAQIADHKFDNEIEVWRLNAEKIGTGQRPERVGDELRKILAAD